MTSINISHGRPNRKRWRYITRKNFVGISAGFTISFLVLNFLWHRNSNDPYREQEILLKQRHYDALLRHDEDEIQIISGVVAPIADKSYDVAAGEPISYYHCGPNYGQLMDSHNTNKQEILLLHGAAFTKEDWRSSRILEKLCTAGGTTDALSITAVDLSVKANGVELLQTIRGLSSEGIVTGAPLVIVTPSASGKAILTAAKIDLKDVNTKAAYTKKLLESMVKGWVPVASGAVRSASEESLGLFITNNIPILAVHRTQDKPGKIVSQRLSEMAQAHVVELEGGHPCYLNSPDEFVKHLLLFVNDVYGVRSSK